MPDTIQTGSQTQGQTLNQGPIQTTASSPIAPVAQATPVRPVAESPLLSLSRESSMLVWARWLFIAAVAIVPIVMIPTTWFPFQLTKLAMFCLLLALSCILLGIHAWRERSIAVPRSPLAMAIAGLIGAVAVSTLISQSPSASFMGDGTETDTLLFFVLAAATFVAGAMLMKTAAHGKSLLAVIVYTGLFAALFQALQFALGPNLFGLSVFSTPSVNLIGKWNDLAVFMGFMAAVALFSIDWLKVSLYPRIAAIVMLVSSAGMLATINLDVVWWTLLGLALVLGVGTFLRNRALPGNVISKLPFASIAVLVVSVAALIWGSVASGAITNALSINELEVRPSAQASTEILRQTYAQSTFTTLFGSGPNTFTEQWLLYKPQEINLSAFWNVDFAAGFGAVPTMFVTLGVVGGVLLLLIIALCAIALVRGLRSGEVGSAAMALVGGALFLLVLSVLYVTSQMILLAAFALMGAYAGIAFAGRTPMLTYTASRIVFVGALLILVLIPVASAGAIGQRVAASMYFGKALAAASSSDIASASAYTARSLSIYKNDDAHRLAASAHMAQANAVAQSTEGDQAARTQAFQSSVSAAVVEAQAAIQHSPQKYGNWLALANIYEALIPAQVEGAIQSAEQSYIEAIRRSPRNPGLYLSAARMEGTAGNEQALRDAINQALTLKPNYTDAVLLIVQLEIAKNNLQGAINASAAAVQTAPDNAGLWFQLGLLALNAGAVNDAALALERALTLMPDYANAKYFLGLAYYNQGKTAESAGLFADLAAANPENQEVARILSNIRAGKPPFDGMQTGGNPTQPTTPPVKEQ